MALSWNRRRFLAALGAAAGSVALGLQVSACSDSAGTDDKPTPGAPLSPAELDRIAAFALVLFPPDDDRERKELDTVVRWWAKGQTTRGPHLELYRNGLAALAAKSTNENLAALKDELLEGIYSSSVGWRSVGYTTWPGVPSGPVEYTKRPPSAERVAAMPIAEIFG
jgi:hypothetical protein